MLPNKKKTKFSGLSCVQNFIFVHTNPYLAISKLTIFTLLVYIFVHTNLLTKNFFGSNIFFIYFKMELRRRWRYEVRKNYDAKNLEKVFENVDYKTLFKALVKFDCFIENEKKLDGIYGFFLDHKPIISFLNPVIVDKCLELQPPEKSMEKY